MNYLPVETKEQILLSLREPKDIYQACTTSREHLSICSDQGFWRERFRREGLYILEMGRDFTDWLRIYEKAIRASEVADRILQKQEKVVVDMVLVTKPRVLQLFRSDTTMLDFYLQWRKADSKRKPKDFEAPVYYIEFLLDKPGFYRYHLIQGTSQTLPSGLVIIPIKFKSGAGFLRERDLQVLLYRLAYFDYPF
nr:DNA-directed RNA polymerase subunit [Cedratvirus borely]